MEIMVTKELEERNALKNTEQALDGRAQNGFRDIQVDKKGYGTLNRSSARISNHWPKRLLDLLARLRSQVYSL